jgi:cytochrome c-type protein NapB
MKKLLLLGAIVLSSLLGAAQAEPVQSLRGATPIDAPENTPSMTRWERDHAPIARDFVHQPPLIPHTIEGYTVNLKVNKCLTCHSWSNYQQSKATKISQTHFKDRDGNDLSNVSARRYFCTQCHVPQADAQPLVENTFKPAIGR